MADELIDKLRTGIDAFNRTGELEARFLAPEFELHQASSIVDTAGVFRGPDALSDSLGELSESFEELTFEPEGFAEAPSGEVVVQIHVRGRGRGSGMEIDNHIAWVWTFRDGLAVRLVVHENPGNALRTLGLGP